MGDIKVFDNILHEDLFNDLLAITLNPEFEWNLCETAYAGSGGDRLKSTELSFAKIYLAEDIAKHPIISEVATMIKVALLNAGVRMEHGIFRIRWGFLFPKSDTENLISPPHVDAPYPHKTGLIYLNDSDGDTILYNETFDFSKVEDTLAVDMGVETEGVDFTEKTRVEHVANRLLLFPGEHYHSSSLPCKSQARLNLNFNYL